MSTRYRGGPSNSLNLICIEHPRIAIQRHVWRGQAQHFEAFPREEFKRTDEGWIRE